MYRFHKGFLVQILLLSQSALVLAAGEKFSFDIKGLKAAEIFLESDRKLDECLSLDASSELRVDVENRKSICDSAVGGLSVAGVRGSAGAMRKLAWMYSEGVYVAKNEHIGATLYQLSADAGDPDAMLRYALILSEGVLVARDQDNAILLLEKASRLGNAAAQLQIAELLIGKRRFDEAAAWLELACNVGSIKKAQEALGSIENKNTFHRQRAVELARAIAKESPLSVDEKPPESIGQCVLKGM